MLVCALWIICISSNIYAVDKDFKNYKKPTDKILQKYLTKTQYNITQKNWTESAYQNAFWKNYSTGIYVDIVSGEPLFSSTDKYDSQTWRPSFTKPIWEKSITTKADNELWSTRTEVRSKYADSHLGHVFDDGPADKWGMRYCINSASLKFIPQKNMKKLWYAKYLKLFK